MTEEDFVEVSPDIEKKIIIKGEYGRMPDLGWKCVVQVNYDDTNNEEDKCQSSTCEITIGTSITPKSRLIENCIRTMHLLEQSCFLIKLERQNESYRVTITLKSYQEKPYIFEWTENEKLEASIFYKNMGAQLFKENKIEEAFYKYSLALKLTLLLDAVLEEDEQPADINNLRVSLYNNLAACQLHFKNYVSVIELCNKSINVNSTSKGLYRRATAYIELKEYEKAENDLVNLLKIEPKNKAAIEKYKLVRELDKFNRENYESIVKKMFS